MDLWIFVFSAKMSFEQRLRWFDWICEATTSVFRKTRLKDVERVVKVGVCSAAWLWEENMSSSHWKPEVSPPLLNTHSSVFPLVLTDPGPALLTDWGRPPLCRGLCVSAEPGTPINLDVNRWQPERQTQVNSVSATPHRVTVFIFVTALKTLLSSKMNRSKTPIPILPSCSTVTWILELCSHNFSGRNTSVAQKGLG